MTLARAPLERTEAAVRLAVGRLICGAPALRDRPRLRHQLGLDLLAVGRCVAEQIDEELQITEDLAGAPVGSLGAGDKLDLGANRAAGETIRSLRDAVDFPTFVSGLITGVFQAIWRSNVDQMEAIADLLRAVSASTSQFAASSISDLDAARYAAQVLPGLQVEDAKGRVRLKAAEPRVLADLDAVARALGATRVELEGGDVVRRLLPVARRALGRVKQSSLANLVMMGLNRITVDKGQLHASMDLRVDARSSADSTAHGRLDSRTRAGLSGGAAGVGWGVSASASTTVGVVKEDKNASSEELASRAQLRSSVDLVFHSEPIQLDAMASADLRKTLVEKTTNPSAWANESLLKDGARSSFSNLEAPPDAPEPPKVARHPAELANAADDQGPTGEPEPEKKRKPEPQQTTDPNEEAKEYE